MVRSRLVSEIHGSDGFTSLRRLVAAFGGMVAIGLVAYLGGSSWYMGRLLPGTVIGDRNVGGMTLPEARAVLAHGLGTAMVKLAINGQQFAFTPTDLGVTYQVGGSLRQVYDGQHQAWSLARPQRHSPLNYTVDTPTLTGVIGAVAAKIGVAPVDAAVVVKVGRVSTIADKPGYTVDRVGLARLIEQGLGTGASVVLSASPRPQPATILASHLSSTVTAAKTLMTAQVSLAYGAGAWSPSAATIGSWLAFTRSSGADTSTLVPVVDAAQVKNYVQIIANSVDVAPVNQLVTTTNGIDTVNQTGVNGTAIDQDAAVAAIVASVSSLQPLAYTITDHPVPFKTINTSFTVLDYPKYIEVNLSKQHAWVWQDGQIIYDTPVTSGASGAGFGTVTGLFSIYYKTTNTWLNGQQYGPRYDYNDFVKYWMPFYQGYGLHDASWRNGNFGETSGPFGYVYDGSHGCINLPDAAAEFIYNWSDVGTPVWVHT